MFSPSQDVTEFNLLWCFCKA